MKRGKVTVFYIIALLLIASFSTQPCYAADRFTYNYRDPFDSGNSFNRGGSLNISDYTEEYITCIYDVTRECIHSGQFKSKTALDGDITFWYDGYGLIRRAVLAEGAENNLYSETYYYDEGGNFVFAYYESSEYGQHRAFFYGDTMVKWKFTSTTGESVTYEAETDDSDYVQMQEYVLNAQAKVYEAAYSKLHAIPAGKGKSTNRAEPTQASVLLTPKPIQETEVVDNKPKESPYNEILALYSLLITMTEDKNLFTLDDTERTQIASDPQYSYLYTGAEYDTIQERRDNDIYSSWVLSIVDEYTTLDAWSLRDLNGDGIEELLIWNLQAGRLNYIYTIENGRPYLVSNSDMRLMYYLLPDNRIFYYWSGGADTHTAYVLSFNGHSFEIEDNISVYQGEGVGQYSTDDANKKASEYIGKSIICSYTEF